MIGLLISLIKIADILRSQKLNALENWLVRLPFSIYFGWITVATIANITVLLVSLGWNGFGLSDVFWTVVVLLVGAVIGSWRTIHDRNIPYALVLIWAYGAILSKHLSATGFAGQYPAVIYTVIGCLIVFAAMAVYAGVKGRDKK
jgi:FtsH-binding integral membrane protein